MKRHMKNLVRVFVVLILASVAFVIWRSEVGRATTYNENIDTLNVRIRQWAHYYRTVDSSTARAARRRFYYEQVVHVLMERGLPRAKAELYAEIPTVESEWRQTAISSSGALGIWQFKPDVAEELGYSTADLMDPFIATECAADHLLALDRLYKGDAAKVLFAYNGGLGELDGLLRRYRTDDPWMVVFLFRDI